ncbi:MAG: hypothetical protein ABF293_02870 [Flavobacteriaceae bacterium]
MLWLIIGILFISLILYVLFLPLELVINTIQNQYYIRAGAIAKARFAIDENYLFRIELKALGIPHTIYPLRKKKKIKKDSKPEKKKRSRRFKWSYVNTGIRLIRSFELKQFALSLDTGNCITNAKLYPVFAFLNYKGGNFQVNFKGENQLHLHLQNRPIRIVKSFINPKKFYYGITL